MVYGRDLDTAAPSPDHYCADSGSKWCHQFKMSAPVSGPFWLHLFFYSGRKWRRVVHLYIQPMLEIQAGKPPQQTGSHADMDTE